MRFRILVVALLVLLATPVSYAQNVAHTAKARAEILHLIRREKLDLILPIAMRENGIDMWIHVIRAGNPDPMSVHFGGASGYLIFTDRGGDRIERAVLGGGGHPELFDIFGSDDLARAVEGYNRGSVDESVYDEIRDFVGDRDPATIAVNTSEWLAISDGISHSDYMKLESILERALSREVITPGVTTLDDVGWWVREEMFKQGLSSGTSLGVSIPRILYSAVSEAIDPPDVRWWIHHGSYVIQRGDFMTFDIGVRYLDYFVTDYKRNAYVMREGEVSVPEPIQLAYDRAIGAQPIIRKQIKVGQTAKETLDKIVAALETAGYIYTPFIDIGTQDYEMVQEAMIGAGTERSGFSIDLHSQGNNGGSLVTVGPSVAPFRSDRNDIVIKENHIFSFEYMVHTNLPDRPNFPASLNIEGNHVVTNQGVEFLYPPNERILIIR